MPITTIYSQAWATVKVNTGAFKTNDDYNRTGAPAFGSDAVDTDYPKISRTEDVKVVAAAGPAGENVLDRDGSYGDAGVRFWGLGTEEGKPSAPTATTGEFWNADAGRARISYKFNAAAWTNAEGAAYYPLLALMSAGGADMITVAAQFDSATTPRPSFVVNVAWSTWSSGGDVYVQDDGTGGDWSTARAFPRATYEDQWYELIVVHRCGTIVGAWDDVTADGEFTVSLRHIATDTTEDLLTVSGIALFASDYYEVAHHQLKQVAVGFYGMFGQATNLVIESGEDDTPPGLTGYFKWGLSAETLIHTTTPVAIADVDEWVAISHVLTGLEPLTTYCYQAVADDGTTLTYGEVICFMTLGGEQTFEDGGVSHPLTWITLTKKDGSKHPYSEVDLNDPEGYYDGYKRPRVERFLTIARGLSDRDGQIEHMSFGALFSDIATDRFDTDREFRGMLADAVNKYLTNRPLEVWFVDDTERRRLGLPRLAAVGYVNDYAPTADLHFELKGADWLKKKFSRKRRAQQGWQPLITAADFPSGPEETFNSPAPLIYGSLGLSGSDAVVGVTITVNPQPTAAPGSFALSLQPGGRLAGITRYYIVAGIVGGQETIQAGPLSATTTDTDQTVRLTWDTVPSATAIYVYSSHRPDFRQFAYTVLAGSATSYDDTTTPPNQDVNWLEGTDWILGLRINLKYYVYANLGGGLFSAPGSAETYLAPFPPEQSIRDRDLDVAWTAHAGATGGYRVIRWRSYYTDWDAQFDRQWDPAAGVLTVTDDIVTITAVTIPSGELIAAAAAGQAEAIFVGLGSYGTSPITVSAFLIAGHACARVGAIYVPATTENVGGETATTYAPVPEAQYGVSWFAPDHPGWIYPEKYVEINGKWFTLIFTTVAPLPAQVFVDVDGVETVGDGTGTLLRSLVDQRLHFMVNFVAPDQAWASGPYLTAADTVFPHLPAIPLVDEASHTLVKAQLAARLASGDYEGATIIGASREFVTAVDALARFHLSGDFDQTFNRKGQDMVTCEPIEAGTNLPVITEVLSIRQSSFSLVDQVQSAFFNIIPYVHSRDYTGRERTGWYGNAEIRSDDSIANYDQEREAPRFELHASRANTPQGAATITDVMARKLARYQDPRRIGTLQMPFEGLEYEPGSTALITHQEGIGADGWVGREVRFIRHEVESTEGIVRLDFYDLTAVLENHEALLRRRQAATIPTKGATHEPQQSETRTPDQRPRPAAAATSRAAPAPRAARSPRPAR